MVLLLSLFDILNTIMPAILTFESQLESEYYASLIYQTHYGFHSSVILTVGIYLYIASWGGRDKTASIYEHDVFFLPVDFAVMDCVD